MSPPTTIDPSWSPAAFAASMTNTSIELGELGLHLDACRHLGGRWLVLRCGIEEVHRFMAARLVTTLMVIALVTVASLLAA
jgi:hypothetical protein